MKIYAISDLHLSFMAKKPMDIFGGHWEGYTDKIKENWQNVVSENDLVLIAGDISWAMKLEETMADLEYIDKLNGKKVIIKGNHEYWWKSISAVREVLPRSISALQNDSARFENVLVAGTRGWQVPESENDPSFTEEDKKIYAREKIRLELALEDMQKKRKAEDKVVCLIHYPPFNSKKEDSYFTELFEKYHVDAVIYGHLHKSAGRYPNIYIKNNIKYYLTSADLISMKPVLIEI